MSLRVLVIPEDPVNDGYILKPLVERIFAELGKPRARISVLSSPRLTGYEHAKKVLREELADRYRHMDLLLFLPDADGKDRAAEFAALERGLHEQGVHLLCCAAVQEVEIWLLAGHRDDLGANWDLVRADVSVKEHFFEPLLDSRGDRQRPGGGRDLLMKKTLGGFESLCQLCPELADLKNRLSRALTEIAGK